MNLKIKTILVLIFLAITYENFSQGIDNNKSYIKSVNKERKEKDREFSKSDKSPIELKSKRNFKGLNYYSILPEWRILASLELNTGHDTIRMKTTTERLPLYIVYGKAHFKLNDNDFALTVYRNVGLMTKPGFEDYLFIPFRDETSGSGSYGGGRYIDAHIQDNDQIVIDFNRSYNPYCVYSKKYSCPIPPTENFIDYPVKAGEMDYNHQ